MGFYLEVCVFLRNGHVLSVTLPVREVSDLTDDRRSNGIAKCNVTVWTKELSNVCSSEPMHTEDADLFNL